jgi:ribonuclease-3
MELHKLEDTLGYTFHNKTLLTQALTHASAAHEQRGKKESYERLEFLGDSVLGFLAAEYFFSKYPQNTEGDLTKMRAASVCESALADCAQALRLQDFIFLGKGDAAAGGYTRGALLCDVFEAVLAAIFLDGGLEAAKTFVLPFLAQEQPQTRVDGKTVLQQLVQEDPDATLIYEHVGEEGPPHDRTFRVQVRLRGDVVGHGQGGSKKRAEQTAALDALKHLRK